MATFDYASLRSRIDAILARFGQPAIVRRLTDAAAGDWDSNTTPSDHNCTAVVVDYDNREIDGTLIIAGDRRAFVAAGSLDIDPTAADRFVWNGSVFKIVNAKPVQPAAVKVVWEVQMRA